MTLAEATIRDSAALIHAAEEARAKLPAQLKNAQKAGASVAQLQDWTGYSRRTIFYLLKEAK